MHNCCFYNERRIIADASVICDGQFQKNMLTLPLRGGLYLIQIRIEEHRKGYTDVYSRRVFKDMLSER